MNNKERFIKLGWQILEHKYRYYILSKPVLQDFDYDMLEKEYDALAQVLGEEPTASNMVDFDMNRHSCKLVAAKLSKKKKRSSRKRKKV